MNSPSRLPEAAAPEAHGPEAHALEAHALEAHAPEAHALEAPEAYDASRKHHAGPMRIWRAARHSFDGLRAAWTEGAFRQEVLLTVVTIPLACWLEVTRVERALLIASIIMVLIVELLNSAVEAAIDRIDIGLHPLSKRAKDLGSAAVLLSLVLAAVVWALILLK